MAEIIDNRAFRIRTMKEIIRHLHDGGDPDEVRNKLKELVRETDSSEVAAMEQQLISEGMRVEEVQSMCDLHSSVLQEILTDPEPPEVLQGHPIDTFKRENEAIRSALKELGDCLAALNVRASDATADEDILALQEIAHRLMDVDKHYQRKENLLFSCLERHDITGPSKVMWGKDDEVREAMKGLLEVLAAARGKAAGEVAELVQKTTEALMQAVEEMIVKEEMILLPMAASTLTEEEWGEIWRQSPEYGWCLVEPRDGYKPPVASPSPETAKLEDNQAVTFAAGSLTHAQLIGLMNTLPVDITFVDSDDRVRFFSEGADRVFERSKAIIGRKVQHCHPPKSAHIVEQILDDFRSGRQSVAEFWINFHGKFVHIRYFAVRDESGAYQGTLEVTQDLTPLRALEGERRLLEY